MFVPVEHFELPINYRCGKDILKYVNRQHHVGILPRPNATDGNVLRIDENAMHKKIRPDDFVIGRCRETIKKNRANKYLKEMK